MRFQPNQQVHGLPARIHRLSLYMHLFSPTAKYFTWPALATILHTKAALTKQGCLIQIQAPRVTCPCLKTSFALVKHRFQTAISCLRAERCVMTLRQTTAMANGMASNLPMNSTGPPTALPK